MLYLAGLYKTRAYWYREVHSISYFDNPIGWVIANEQYRAAMGWN